MCRRKFWLIRWNANWQKLKTIWGQKIAKEIKLKRNKVEMKHTRYEYQYKSHIGERPKNIYEAN